MIDNNDNHQIRLARMANLDLLRCIAILAVIFYHLGRLDLWPRGIPGIKSIGGGWAGVDLFFVLSGWLIGGLYWRELRAAHDVQIARFMLRRLMRTIPPYLVMLQIAWASKHFFTTKGATYDWGYLIFIQNYYERMPYFIISWSLCIEEHFYLVLPTALLFMRKLGRGIHLVFAVAVIGPLVGRLLTVPEGASYFGYHTTATHLRLEGLALGVWCSYIHSFHPLAWSRLRTGAKFLLLPAVVYAFTIRWRSTDWHNHWGFTLIAISFTIMLVALVEARTLLPWIGGIIYSVANASYSLYLTHTTAIHIYEKGIMKNESLPDFVGDLPGLLHLAGILVLIFSSGYIFHILIERTSIRLRDRYVPRRTTP